MDADSYEKSDYIPIIIGVSGHRDINKNITEELKNKIKEVLRNIKIKHPHSPIKLLTPLAEGADSIVASVALDLEIDLIVPLPMPKDEYKKDFTDNESIKNFEVLLSKAKNYFELSNLTKSGNDLSYDDLETRNSLYYNTGVYIAKNSQILIALWDGKESDSIGGTSSIIKFKLNNTSDDLVKNENPLDQTDSGPVYHILMPRNNEDLINQEKFTLKIYYPTYWRNTSDAEKYYQNILLSIDELNNEIYNSLKKIKSIKDDNFNLSNRSYILNKFEEILLMRFKIIDYLATNRKSNRIISLRLILLIIVIAFLLFNIYLGFYPDVYLLTCYPILLGLASTIYYLSKKKGFEIKHEDYRALAEALRVQIFWTINDISQSTADYFLRNHQSELEWIKYALRNWTKPEFFEFKNTFSRGIKDEIEIHNLSYNYWIDSQKDWYYEQSNVNQKKYSKLKFVGNLLFGAGLLFSVILIFLEIYKYQLTNDIIDLANKLILLMISLTLSCAAAFHGYAEKMVFSEQAKLYKRMFDLFKLVSDKLHYLNLKNDSIGFNKVLFELGKESLQENADWLLIHRSRPLELQSLDILK